MTDWVSLGKECVTKARKVLHELNDIKVMRDRMNIQTNADLASNRTIKETLTKSGVTCNLVSEEEEKQIH